MPDLADLLPVPSGVQLWTDPAEADWVLDRLWPWGRPYMQVGSLIPQGFEDYARIAHAGGRIDEGSLPREQTRELAALLEPFTSTPGVCWFCVWDGFGWWGPGSSAVLTLVPGRGSRPRPSRFQRWKGRRRASRRAAGTRRRLAPIPRVRAPGRDYFLFRGPVAASTELDFGELTYQSPNLWWPDDKAWCVATEIDISFTYVGGRRDVIDQVVSAPELKAAFVELDAPIVPGPV